MKLKGIFLAAAMVCALGLFAEEKTVEHDWCTITYPTVVMPGRNFNVSLKLKQAPEGAKVGADLHHEGGGYIAWGGRPKKAQLDKVYTFQYKAPQPDEDDTGLQVACYLTKKGWNEAIKQTFSPTIKVDAAAAPAVAAPKVDENGNIITDYPWCTVTMPQKVAPDTAFTVTVVPKKGCEGFKIGGDMHKAKVGQYLGYGSWGGTPKKVKADLKPLTFKYKMLSFVSEDQGGQIIFYLTKKGWDEATEKAACPVILPIVTEAVLKTRRPETATLKKSWMRFTGVTDKDGNAPVWQAGKTVVATLEYFVDPSDDWGKTKIALWSVGPWIDNPDGKYSTKRYHVQYPLWPPEKTAEIGKVSTVQWKIKLPKAFASQAPEKGKFGDSLLLIAFFKGADNKAWPGQCRYGLPVFSRGDGYFELDAKTPGNLFTYDEPVSMFITPSKKAEGMTPTDLTWKITNVTGAEVAKGTVKFPNADGTPTEVPLKLEERGTFLFRVDMPGKDAREITFARIPNIQKIIGNGPTRFGGQKFFGNLEAVKAARKMGLSSCRVWLSWGGLEPKRGMYNEKAWESLRKGMADLKANNIRPVLMLNGIPAWAITNPNVYGGEFTALPVDDAAVESIVTKLATEFKDEAIGFEWQNEIVPGTACKDPVADYLRMCRVADRASKKVNPKFRNQIAGGLWPQTFRQSLIAAGIMDFTDILPIHYGTGSAVRGAQRDLASGGADKRAAVWDNETANGLSTWGMPLTEAMKIQSQSDYYFTRLPDELMAGCEHIVLFGGEPDAAGNWSHFWGDMSPRPCATAIAVVIEALGDSTPIGSFTVGKGDTLRLFERPGRPPVMVVSSIEKDGETVTIPIGNKPVIKIDQQGNESKLSDGGSCTVKLTSSPYLIEGGDANVLKSHLVMSFPGLAEAIPTYTVIAGSDLELPLRFENKLDREIGFTVTLTPAPGKTAPITVGKLVPGTHVTELLKVAGVTPGITKCVLTLKFTDASLPVIKRSIVINAVKPDEIGNLAKNPGFETAGSTEDAADNWGNSGTHGKRIKFENADEVGHGNYVYKFSDTNKQYHSISQGVGKLPTVGGDYVYSFWIKADNLQTGSNMGGSRIDGDDWNMHWLRVFQAPLNQPEWQVFRKRITLPNGANSANLTPVCNGKGTSLIDNVIFVPYEGTEFTAFAPKTGKIKIDGDISDFNKSEPVPLIGRNQLKLVNKDYDWSPKNLSGVAYFNYNKDYLYVAIDVVDDKHVATKIEENCAKEDSVRIAIHPMNRIPGEDSKAFCFDLSSVNPGGSGKHTIFRPAELSGGLKSGSLAKDSSVYDIVVKRQGNHTIYEVAMPWSDLGGAHGVIGGRIGLSLQLTDNDGNGPAAKMLWGEGMDPWSPVSFGMLTLTE